MKPKSIGIAVFSLVVAGFCLPAFSLQGEGSNGIVQASALRVRSEPGGAINDKLPQGTTVSILETREAGGDGQKTNWYKIEYLKDGAKKMGYVSADWIVPTSDGSKPAASPVVTTATEEIPAPAVVPDAVPAPAVVPSPILAPAPAPPALPPAKPADWFSSVHQKDPNSQDWIGLKNFWMKRYTDNTLKYLAEANSLTPNLEPAEINAHLDTFLQDAGTEVAWARNHANTYRTKGLDLSTPLAEKGDYIARSLAADDLANLLQIYMTAVNAAKSTSKAKRK